MLRSIRGSLTVVAGVALIVSLGFSSAWGAPLVVPTDVTSVSNPGDTWRGGWGSSLAPDYSIRVTCSGIYYCVDRTPGSVIDTSALGSYNVSLVGEGTLFTHIVDIQGTYNYPPLLGWPPSTPGMSNPLEGVWYFHVLPYSVEGGGPLEFGTQIDVPIGIDQTPPTAVTGVLVSPDPSVAPAVSCVTGGTRATVSWTGSDYDILSGTAYYTVYIDGNAAVSGSSDASVSIPASMPPVWYQPSWTQPYRVTVEDLAPGRHEVKVSATDLANNEGSKSAAAVVYSDPDSPAITVTTPDTCGRYVVLTCSASDLGGVQFVDWYIDGRYVGRAGSAPYSVWTDMSAFGRGGHTVTGVVADMMGRTASAAKWMTVLNLTIPYVTRISDSPDPFYPIRRDRYRDDMVLRFRLAERSAVWVQVFDSSNNLVRTMWCGWRRSGSNSLKWNGVRDDGSIQAGDYHYRIIADDGQGNTYYSGWGWTRIRAYIIKRLSRNRVRVIYH